jgi:hypothetical protein
VFHVRHTADTVLAAVGERARQETETA